MKKILIFMGLLILAGCAKRAVIVPQVEPVVIKEIEEDAGLGLLNVYFDFDKSVIRDDMLPAVNHNADMLRNYPEIRIRIEGHCDERGTDNYNMALGMRRAQEVKNYLINAGIDPNRIDTISYGEMRPVALGHNEDAWAENRRNEMTIMTGRPDNKGGWIEIWETQ